jgi:hypothetical protein
MLNDIKCSIQIPDVPGLEKDALTVGRHFYLSCDGTWDKSFDFSKAFVAVDESNKNTIKIFKIEARNANSFDVDLILYVAGELKTTNFKITDGKTEIDLGSQDFKVKSVIEKTEKPPEPFGYVVSSLQWPWQYSAGILLFFILTIGCVIAFFMNKLKWRDRIERLKNFDSPLPADSQFYKELRKSEKKDYPMSELERLSKVYILRSYKVPIFELSSRAVIGYIKKTKPRLKSERRLIFNLLKDIDLLKKNDNFEKRKKFVDQMYRFVDLTEDQKQRGHL